jgi:hypothetical protein
MMAIQQGVPRLGGIHLLADGRAPRRPEWRYSYAVALVVARGCVAAVPAGSRGALVPIRIVSGRREAAGR